jgi:hypothetical protein
MMKLHVMNMDLYSGLPSFAQVGSTNLMWQLVGTMDQALSGVKNADILAPTESKFTLFVAHDVNLSAIAAFLGGVTWKAEGFQTNDPGPAGALVFELHRVKQSGQLILRDSDSGPDAPRYDSHAGDASSAHPPDDPCMRRPLRLPLRPVQDLYHRSCTPGLPRKVGEVVIL